MTDRLTPEQIAAAIRDPESGAMPVQISVYCDNCGTTATRDYLVREDSTKAERFEVARTHLAKNEGWHCEVLGDFCPDCITALPESTEETDPR